MTSELAKAAANYTTGWAPPVWDSERIALVRKAIAPPTASAADVEFFIAWCKRTQLDPFVKQAYFVERKSKDASGNWNVRHEPMAAEAGMAARADVEADFLGMKSSAVYAGDVFKVDADAGQVTHQWDLESRAKAGNRLVGAWAHARRKGRDVPIVWVQVEQRIQTRYDNGKQVPTSFWAKDAAGMIAKCARAMAYRLAFPNLFSGVFIREELEADEVTGGPTPGPSGPPLTVDTSAVNRLAAKLGVTLGQPLEARISVVESIPVHVDPPISEPPPRASPPVPDAPPDVTPSGETTAAPPMAKEEEEPGPVLPFGKAKGKSIASLSTVVLEEALQEAQVRLAKASGKESWFNAAQEGVRLVSDEIANRDGKEIPFP